MSTDESKNLPESVPHDDMELFLKECRLGGMKMVCCWHDPHTGRPDQSYTEIVLNPRTGWVHLLDNDEDEGVIATYMPTGYYKNPNPLWKRALTTEELRELYKESRQ